QVFQDYGFHPLVQRWIIGQCLCVDERTVGSYGVRPAQRRLPAPRRPRGGAQIQHPARRGRAQRSVLLLLRPALRLPTRAQRSHSGWVGAGASPGCPSTSHPFLLALSKALFPASPALQAGWSCPKCTFINKPTRPGCEMCSGARPDDYVVPGGYTPDETELWRMQQEQEGIRQYQQ
ncbi:RanBP-type and C3HC4-type zinc finger-containing protein 1, partial [Dryobates pubescens]